MSHHPKPTSGDDGYRPTPAGGPRVRTDIIDVYIVRRPSHSTDAIEFLLLQRSAAPLSGSWQPVMGHIEMGESAVTTAIREMREETGLAPSAPALLGMWALEQTYPYFVAAIDAIVMSPRFVVEVAPSWEPTLNAEHTAARWIALPREPDQAPPTQLRAALDQFHWPGQQSAALEILRSILPPDSHARSTLAVDLSV